MLITATMTDCLAFLTSAQPSSGLAWQLMVFPRGLTVFSPLRLLKIFGTMIDSFLLPRFPSSAERVAERASHLHILRGRHCLLSLKSILKKILRALARSRCTNSIMSGESGSCCIMYAADGEAERSAAASD